MEKLNISSNADIGNTSEQPTLGVNDIGFNYFNTTLKNLYGGMELIGLHILIVVVLLRLLLLSQVQ